mgnify:CR=1 FL=1
MTVNLAELLPQITALADQAGAVIMKHFRGEIEVRTKGDASPVTVADEASEAVILKGLATLTPSIPVVSEEQVAAGDVPDLDVGPFWLVDPLDGTKEFIDRKDEFTVNIALIGNDKPILGVVLAPARGRAWWEAKQLGASVRNAAGKVWGIQVRPAPAGCLTAMISRSQVMPIPKPFCSMPVSSG